MIFIFLSFFFSLFIYPSHFFVSLSCFLYVSSCFLLSYLLSFPPSVVCIIYISFPTMSYFLSHVLLIFYVIYSILTISFVLSLPLDCFRIVRFFSNSHVLFVLLVFPFSIVFLSCFLSLLSNYCLV